MGHRPIKNHPTQDTHRTFTIALQHDSTDRNLHRKCRHTQGRDMQIFTIVKVLIGATTFATYSAQAQSSFPNPFLNGAPYKNCSASEVRLIESGTRNTNIPQLPPRSAQRILLFDQTYLPNQNDPETTRKVLGYGRRAVPKILAELNKLGVIDEIKKVAPLYDVDPIQILAPVVVEMSFNGFLDTAIQDRFVQLRETDLEKKSRMLNSLLANPEVKQCMDAKISNYWKWKCVDYFTSAYNGSHLGTALSGIRTYGIAQFNPVLVWSLNDVVQKYGKQRAVKFGDFKTSLEIVLSPKEVLHYIAAYVRIGREIYRDVACFEIRQNLAIVSTIYNLGDEYQRAHIAKNRWHILGQAPSENYFGWYAQMFEREMRAAL